LKRSENVGLRLEENALLLIPLWKMKPPSK